MDVQYAPPTDRAEVVEVADGQAWIRVREPDGRIVYEFGEDDPAPIEAVLTWANRWNQSAVAHWPDRWILAAAEKQGLTDHTPLRVGLYEEGKGPTLLQDEVDRARASR